MAQYKTLKSVAHALPRSFVAAISYADSDVAACHLLRVARGGGPDRWEVDVLHGGRVATSAPPAFVAACAQWAGDFGRLVTASNAALDMIGAASLVVSVRPSREADQPEFKGHVTVRALLRDDRGREYAGEFTHGLLCVGAHGQPNDGWC